MKILLIDDDDIVLSFMRTCLEEALPDAEIAEYPIRSLGKPADDFDWSAFDLLLLDHHLGDGESGLDWLEEFGQRPGFPRTILITSDASPRLVGTAVASGASGYLNKTKLTPARFTAAVHDALGLQPVHASGAEVEPDRGAQAARPAPPPVEPASSRDGEGTEMRLDELDTRASYRMRRVIGRGAMSSVYLAERVEDGATVAIKVLDKELSEDESLVQRFRREGEIVIGLNSPYVVRVYEQGFTNGNGYISMEFFGRGDLKQQISLGVDPAMAVEYLYNIVCGLKAIHDSGVVHRDLKPANIMFRSDGSLALVDFGVAKSDDGDLSLTNTGTVLGTPHYLSPEQAQGYEADARSDIYAAGAMFHEMLTGRPPYGGTTLSALVYEHVYGEVPKLPEPMAHLQPLLETMMAKDPDERVSSAGELLQVIEAIGAPE